MDVVSAYRPMGYPCREFVVVYYDPDITSKEAVWNGMKAGEEEDKKKTGRGGSCLGLILEGVRTELEGITVHVENPVARQGDLFRIVISGSDVAPEVDLPEGWRVLDRSVSHVVVQSSGTDEQPKCPITLRFGDREIRQEVEVIGGHTKRTGGGSVPDTGKGKEGKK